MNTLTLNPSQRSAILAAQAAEGGYAVPDPMGTHNDATRPRSKQCLSNDQDAGAAHYPSLVAAPPLHNALISTATWASDPGVGRTHNEDAILCRPELGLYGVADGMGGFNAGEVASGIVIETLERRLSSVPAGLDRSSLASLLMSAINEANAAVLRTSARRPECLGMGTTLALLWLTPQGLIHAHIGDSRIYAYQNGQLRRLTRDHVIEELPEVLRGRLGDENAARKGILTRAIGAETLVEADYQWYETIAGMLFLLCTDGLSDSLDEQDLQAKLGTTTSDLAQKLVNQALDLGAADNISALVVRVSKA